MTGHVVCPGPTARRSPGAGRGSPGSPAAPCEPWPPGACGPPQLAGLWSPARRGCHGRGAGPALAALAVLPAGELPTRSAVLATGERLRRGSRRGRSARSEAVWSGIAAAAPTAPTEAKPMASAATTAVLRPDQVGGVTAGAVEGGPGCAGGGPPGRRERRSPSSGSPSCGRSRWASRRSLLLGSGYDLTLAVVAVATLWPRYRPAEHPAQSASQDAYRFTAGLFQPRRPHCRA